MRLDVRHLPGTPLLYRDYIHRFGAVAAYFVQDPRDGGGFRTHADQRERRSYPRAELSAVLRFQNQNWGAPPGVTRHIEELTRPDSVAVVTGQQTGLFGGPLFTLYKALTTLALAGQLQETLHRPVVPVFWMASEDHDIAEADHVQLPDRSGGLVAVRHAVWGTPHGFLPANLRLGPAITETLEAVGKLLPSSEFGPGLQEALRQAFTPDRTLADAFARWMIHLLGASGLVFVDPAEVRLKQLAGRIFQQELHEAPRSSQCILSASQSLRSLGYAPQIEARPDGVNCFLLDRGRHPMVREAAGFRLRDSGKLIPAGELLRLAQEEPERFSPNVALRPIVQDALFPTIAYIAGPGELAYFAQLRPVYEAFGVPMPLLIPRATLTLVEPRILQLLDRYRLAFPDLTLEPEQLASRVVRALLPPDLEHALRKARDAVDDIFRGVGEAIAAVDQTLRATVGQTAGHIQGHLDQLERKAVQALKRREAETRQQIQRLRQELMPGGKPQERVFPVLPYLAKHGPPVLETIRRAIGGPGWDHGLVPLQSDRDRDSDSR
jgi:bacillithiol biosynthesis cysteine-adding enzyme BshC